ncbi:putative receptor-type tyrosine-protein phosphatase mu-like [Apostichopus japonicus]|uniref:Putative receptor-type tyrosine-protein phosphatase mu-like n=1 Tax=Stichopus japonicus TaxID=307972 RepID=A0A2G8LB94_STIJA|nr:putative receptor-type tyrosine-protein phosphatase mu-like [Apostichopus japonicus]
MIYGEFLVKCQKLEEHSKYDQRIFTVFLKHGGESRTVKHFHFTDWSDMKIPEFLDPILDFLEIVKNTSQKNVPNTIVHCSAGVGRTGTYITLDAMLDMAQAEGKVNVYKFVTEMRQRRFIVELASLKDTNKKTNETFLTEQFKKLEETSTTPSSSNVSEAKKMENRSRNRFSTILPVEEHRPFLMTNVGENYNNYINASFLNGYKKKRDFFIATQMPLKNTILDFWRLVWDYECSVIIMLNELDDKSQNIRTVMQMQCLGWPNNETVANSPELLLHCVHQLSQWCKESAIDRVLVHCMDGVGRTGVFCGLVAALDQAQAVNEVDIFQLISNMRSAQPLMIQNLVCT